MSPLQPENVEQEDNSMDQFKTQQAVMLLQNTRALKLAIVMSINNGELTDAVRTHLFNDLLQAASFCEVKDATTDSTT